MAAKSHPLTIKINSVQEVRTGEGLWRIKLKAQVGKKENSYEIWSSDEYISDTLRILSFPNTEDVEKFANVQFDKWFKEEGDRLPKNKALLVLHRGKMKTDNPETFLDNLEQQIRTNINLPPNLYKWAKEKAASKGISLSEVIREYLSLVRSTRENTEKWFISKREQVKKRLEKKGFQASFFEITHYLPNATKTLRQKELLEVAQKSELSNTGWPIGVAIKGDSGSPQPKEDGIEAEYSDLKFIKGYDYWYLRKNGDYYFARTLAEDSVETVDPGKTMFFDTRIWRIAEALEHTILLYKNFGVTKNEIVRIRIGLFGLLGRQLGANNPGRAFTFRTRKATANQVTWEIEVSLKQLEKNFKKYVYDTTRTFFVLFDFFEPTVKVVDDIISEYKHEK